MPDSSSSSEYESDAPPSPSALATRPFESDDETEEDDMSDGANIPINEFSIFRLDDPRLVPPPEHSTWEYKPRGVLTLLKDSASATRWQRRQEVRMKTTTTTRWTKIKIKKNARMRNRLWNLTFDYHRFFMT